jgi:para-nitrobenzyl esterase
MRREKSFLTHRGRYLLSAFACAICFGAAVDHQPVVRVAGGSIAGTAEPPGAVFRGIPFAQPPVGKLRWRAPQPLEPWKGVLAATHFSAACMQNPLGTGSFLTPLAKLYGHEYPQTKIAMSEDCLYLNLWTPAWPPPQAGAPVMVWLHGGSNVMGSGAESIYDGAALARKGVVVVTVNYRLGPLGFFSHPELTQESPHHASGNYGLLDQVAALQWVRDNIAQFGGDPGRVTVFGESAGSIDAGLLLCSPLAKGLLQRAIMESGPVLLALNAASLEKGEHFGKEVARLAGLSGASEIEQLRRLPAETVMQKINEVSKRAGDPGTIIDGWFLTEGPGRTFAQGRELPVDFVIGNNGREMSAFRAKGGDGSASLGSGGSPAQAVRVFYGSSTSIVLGMFLMDNTLGRTEAADSWLNDVIAACPEMAMTSLHHATGHHAFVYQFNREIPGNGKKALGAFHGLEIPYVFGTLRDPTWNWLPFEPIDSRLSEIVQAYWTNFAKTGNPNGEGVPGWLEFESREQSAMTFGQTGTAALKRNSRPIYCDVDPNHLRQRLSSLQP